VTNPASFLSSPPLPLIPQNFLTIEERPWRALPINGWSNRPVNRISRPLPPPPFLVFYFCVFFPTIDFSEFPYVSQPCSSAQDQAILANGCPAFFFLEDPPRWVPPSRELVPFDTALSLSTFESAVFHLRHNSPFFSVRSFPPPHFRFPPPFPLNKAKTPTVRIPGVPANRGVYKRLWFVAYGVGFT